MEFHKPTVKQKQCQRINADQQPALRRRSKVVDADIPRWQIEPMSVDVIEDQALNLPAIERAKLIDVLWNSLSTPEAKSREKAWAEESERRVTAFEAGSLAARDAEEIFADLRKRVRQ
jgi:putative addiction module component (TIGR02574 family)